MRQKVFIGSSGEAMDIGRAVQQELDRDFDVTIWDQGVFRPTHDAIDSLCSELSSSDAGVFVLTPDDLTETRGSSSPTARDNVVFELGMFIGGLGRARTFVLIPKSCDAPAERSDRRHDCSLRRRALQPTTARRDGPTLHADCASAKGRPPGGKARTKLRLRLDRAMSRMNKDLEGLLTYETKTAENKIGSGDWPGTISFQLGRTTVRVEVGRIQDYDSSGKG